MRPIPVALAARLRSGATTLARAWLITRRDGARFGFTDHDRDLAFDGVPFRAASARAEDGGAAGQGGGADARILGVLEGDGIDAAGLDAGLWDGARLDWWRVDWTDPALRLHMGAGWITSVRRAGATFVAHIECLDSAFDRPFGRVYARTCDAEVGDARCGVDLNLPAFRSAGVVSAVTGARTFSVSGLDTFADGWFTRGLLLWTAGGQSEVAVHRRSDGVVTLEVTDATAALHVGAAFTITVGCDKRFETCRAKFDNVAAFRGCPHMPGTETMLAGPDTTQPMDGGSRFR